jgi:ABC-type microcin C transport system duplicated ATPase subunit YejF
MAVLEAENLSIAFGDTPVVQGVSFQIERGETLALVGESGSGKSITALGLIGLLPRRAIRTSGRVMLGDTEVSSLDDAALRRIRGARIGMIFQEPMTSLTPVLTIGRQMTEALVTHRRISQAFPVSARILRRDAPARHDRHDARTRAGIADSRRTDDGARRHRPGADS